MGGKTIVKNTGFLYFRMIVMFVIAFFTSRVLLSQLGIHGYGIYNIVGGVVAMFASLRGAFASSIQRFLNYERGLNNLSELPRIFSMGVNIHAVICILFLAIAETFGLWFLNNKLVIPVDRLNAANWVYQLSIVSAMITMLTIPQDAVIIANQKMNIYVYITLLEAFLKLGVIFLLPLINVDPLIVYAFLILFISILIRLITSVYCRRAFAECKYTFFWDKVLFKKLGSFAGWNFLGNAAFSIVNEGSNIILNFFGGAVANAARGLTYQIRGAVEVFINNIQIASAPHLTEIYARKETTNFFETLFTISKFTYFISCIICIPIIVNTSYLLGLWLDEVPANTASFTQLSLTILLIRIFHGSVDTIFKAGGKIKRYQIIDSLTLVLSIPLGFIFLKNGLPLFYVFIAMFICEVANLIFIIILASKTASLNISRYCQRVVLPCFIVSCVSWCVFYGTKLICFSDSLLSNFIFIVLDVLLLGPIVWLIGFSKKEKGFARGFFSKKK